MAQPRAPCFKFNIHTRHGDAAQLMTISGYCGFYLRVTREGYAPIHDAVLERTFESGAANVHEAFFAVLGKPTVESLEYVMGAPALAESWSSAVARRLAARKT